MTDKLTCVDLFSGLGGFSQAMVDRGWEVVRVDIDPKFRPDICADIRELTAEDLPKNPVLVLASPPCTHFSIAAHYIHWKDRLPDKLALADIGLIFYTKFLIEAMRPQFWILENPRGNTRRVLGPPKITTYFGAWGEKWLKPTDLWGELPPMKWPKKPKIHKGAGSGCGGKDERPRDPALQAKIPYALSEAIAKAVERGRLDYFMELGNKLYGVD